jgi:hypothetical protein
LSYTELDVGQTLALLTDIKQGSWFGLSGINKTGNYRAHT